jgi:hypothetical protein
LNGQRFIRLAEGVIACGELCDNLVVVGGGIGQVIKGCANVDGGIGSMILLLSFCCSL